ncbi:MAG: hypothetical protein HY683_01960, partial [Chloroflexi bacterium]|nr:hypothetical protein [Chloroflexota bacterium]
YINYYYFGQFMVAAFVRVTGIPTEVAYNLAVPTFYALVVGAAFSIAFNLAEGARRAAADGRDGADGVPWKSLAAGLTGVLLVAVVGNLDGGGQLVQGAWARLVQHLPFPAFDYWRSSRMMPPDPPGWEITEVPFFTFLFGDLHAHVMALPLSLASLGLGLNLMLQGARRGPWLPQVVTLALLALVLGALSATNAWDLPTFLAIAVAAIAAGEYLRDGRLEVRTVARLGLLLGGLAILATASFAPFHLRYHNAFGGVVPSPAATMLYQYLAIHGLFLLPLVTLLVYETRSLWRAVLFSVVQGLRETAGAPVGGSPGGVPVGLLAMVIPGTALLATAALGYATVAFLTSLLALAALAFWLSLRDARGAGPFTAFVVLLAGVGFAIGLGLDLVTMKGDIDRMNTVFKFYLHGWVLLALAAAYALWRLDYGRLLAGHRQAGARRRRWGHWAWSGLFVLLLAAALVYPVLGTRARLADRFRALPLTLDGAAYMVGASYFDERGAVVLRWDAEAVRWLREHVDGSPVVLEANTPIYRWGSRVSIYTGLPSVVGWQWHQEQQRCGVPGCPDVQERIRDVETIYSTTDSEEALRLLRQYGVRYIVVGETERDYYPSAGLAKFDRMFQEGKLSLAYENQQVKLYEVSASS